MLGGHKDNFLLKITNSFGRNHAYRSRNDPKFKKFIIDYKQGIEEGRITPEFIEEMRSSLDPVMFGILYECVYPLSQDAEIRHLFHHPLLKLKNIVLSPVDDWHFQVDAAQKKNLTTVNVSR